MYNLNFPLVIFFVDHGEFDVFSPKNVIILTISLFTYFTVVLPEMQWSFEVLIITLCNNNRRFISSILLSVP